MPDMWREIWKAYEQVQCGAKIREDIYFKGVTVKVYQCGAVVRIDIKRKF